MADEFEIEKIEPGFITIRHLGEGHHYTFQVVEHDDGRRALSESAIVRQDGHAPHSASFFQFQARAFAETEAGNAGIIGEAIQGGGSPPDSGAARASDFFQDPSFIQFAESYQGDPIGAQFSAPRPGPGPTTIVLREPSTIGTAQPAGRVAERFTFANALAERPIEIRDSALNLVREIRAQIAHMNDSKPNDPEQLAKHQGFVEFLERIAAGLGSIADLLDRAQGSRTAQAEPIFLGPVADAARQLSSDVIDWLTANRANVRNYVMRCGLVGAGYMFLHACGVEGVTAAVIAGLMDQSFSKNGERQK